MSKHHKKIQTCAACGRATNNAYICRRCAKELHDLLVGSKDVDGQPGIVWYIKRLRETAYGQTRMARSLSARSSNQGYALLANRRAVELLAKIAAVLARWEAIVEALRATQRHETGWVHTGSPTKDFERLEVKRARFIAANVVLLRHHCRAVHYLHADMLEFARQAWRIINRPNDVCCGPCPTVIKNWDSVQGRYMSGQRCGTLLYAEENSNTVVCPLCHTLHFVEALREQLKAAVADMLFTRVELCNLMATRLNDPIKAPLFTKLLRTKKLQPREIRHEKQEDGTVIEVPMFTYNDVCAARLRDNRIRSVS